jgi:predicted RNA methylase
MIAATHESKLLAPAASVVDDFSQRLPEAQRQEARFQLLEAVASRLGGFELSRYQRAFKIKAIAQIPALLSAARSVVARVESSKIPPALAVSALAREALDSSTQRKSGAYHTDFRLAEHLARSVSGALKPNSLVIDPACGAGILLTAVSIAVCGADRRLANEWLSNCLFAADLSPHALRGTRISLACLTDDVGVVRKMSANWRVQDSLIAGSKVWTDVAPEGFDVVVANPPWEKIKITRHEFIKAQGISRHYGANYDAFDAERYQYDKAEAQSYGFKLALRYPSLRAGEPDYYVAFTELLMNLAKPGATIGALAPAGLIRSQNTHLLRRLLFREATALSFQVLENRARYFEIDTRFKFLVLQARKRIGEEAPSSVALSHVTCNSGALQNTPTVRIGRASLIRMRPDLTIPEVKSDQEWRLLSHMVEHGIDWSKPNSAWHPDFMREVDMTRDRSSFLEITSNDALPVVEGRMVHQHRFGAKSYAGGTGRSATWDVNAPGASVIKPQFWIDRGALSDSCARRIKKLRAGFCDVTGQTNERSCLAAMIPPGVVCGNKVPTILFPNDPSEERLWLWVALANSLLFDWMVRRVITTTINYFHLLSLPIPPIEPTSLPGRQLIDIARKLSRLDRAGSSRKVHWEMAELRAKADQLVINAYGLKSSDLELIMEDFPLIDGAQPALDGEARPTITYDLILSYSRSTAQAAACRARVDRAAALGAIAYMPSQVALTDDDRASVGEHGKG